MIAETTKNNLIKQLKQVISYSQNLVPEGMNYIEDMVNQWAKAKAPWIEAWGGPILKCQQVSFNLTDEEKEKQFETFVKNSIEDAWEEYGLADFLRFQGWENFFANHVEKPYLDYGVPVGSKIVKSFKYFVTDGERLRKIQDEASVILQSVDVKGTLFLSVHPLDFLSISENTYNWRSCHALDGDYRVGNLNYMLDEATIVAYISDGKEKKLPRFPQEVPWNSKKWRMLLYSHMPDVSMMFAGRQYPIYNEAMLESVKIAYLASMNCNYFKYTKWTNARVEDHNIPSYMLFSPYIHINYSLYALYDIVSDNPNFLGYNDILYSSVYQSHFCYRKHGQYTSKSEPVENYKIRVGKTAYCPYCGKPILFKGVMCCETCYETKKIKTEGEEEWR